MIPAKRKARVACPPGFILFSQDTAALLESALIIQNLREKSNANVVEMQKKGFKSPIVSLPTHALFFLCALLWTAGCANRLAPEWYRKVPENSMYIYARYSMRSKDLKAAITAAEDSARAQIVNLVARNIRELRSQLDREINLSAQPDLLAFFNKKVKAVVNSNLYKIKIKKQRTVKQEETWYTFILLEYPLAAANAALLREIRRDSEMYSRFARAQAFIAFEQQTALVAAYKD